MATDNTTLPVGAGGDTIRTANRAGVKTQIVLLDIGPDAGPENLISASNGLPVAQQGVWSIGVSNFPATQPVSGTFWQATQPVSGTFWQATQPVSIAATVATKPDGAVWALTGTSANVNVTNASLAVTGTFWQATQPVSGTVTANQGTANTLANAWSVKVTDGTTAAGVIVGTTALKTDKSSVAGTATATAAAGVQLVGIEGSTGTSFETTAGVMNSNLARVANTAVGTPTNFGTTPGAVVALQVNSSAFVGTTAAVASSAGVQKVGVVGGVAGAAIDAVITAATAPANGLAVLSVNNTTAPSLATGQSVALQCGWDGSVFIQNGRRSNIKAATGTIASTTPATMLAAQAAGIFADLAGLVLTVAAIATTADAIITVNISDGTATYKFGINTGAITTVGNVDTDKVVVNFSPPIPATAAATAWTIALSTANTTVAYVATFILQKAS